MTMLVDVVTIFPGLFAVPLETGMLRKARQVGALVPRVWDLREFTIDRHRQVDDYPYGGGRGMVLKPEPLFEAVETLRTPSARVILLSPQGARFSQSRAVALARERHLILLAGRYEGVDERVRNLLDEEISIGDYVLTGGELPALVLIDAVARLLPGVLSEEATAQESFMEGLLDHPQYTRPEVFRGWEVPEVLRSGDHGRVRAWRRREAIRRTAGARPDLLAGVGLSPEERAWVEEMLQKGAVSHEPGQGA